MASFGRSGGAAHVTYGSADLNGQLAPVWEAIGVFGGNAVGPMIGSGGYPMPATLPGSYAGGSTGYGASGGGLSAPVLVGLLVLGAIGIYIVHRLHWRA